VGRLSSSTVTDAPPTGVVIGAVVDSVAVVVTFDAATATRCDRDRE